jgi:integrase
MSCSDLWILRHVARRAPGGSPKRPSPAREPGQRRRRRRLEAGTVRVFRQLAEQRGGGFAFGPPKSDAGKRVVVIPDVIMPIVKQQMSWVAQPGEETLVFVTATGAPLRHSNFRRRVWLPALQEAGLPMIHFHDLRHTRNELAATAGAGLRELMDRMGHFTSRAALIYLHGSKERQQAVADALSQFTIDALKRRPVDRSGTQRARKRRGAS